MTNRPSRTMGCALITGILILLTACGTTGYRSPISKFQDASSVVIASTRIYLTELNKVERDKYINEQVSRKAQIQLIQIEAVQVFSRDGLKARLDALDQLSTYGDLLAKLANNDAPERITVQAQGLGDALKNLSDTVNGLTGSENQNFKTAVDPVATLIGEVLNLIVQQKIKDALDKAIQAGDAPINRLLNVIRSDITVAYERKRNALSEMRVILVDEYNREVQKGDGADPEKLRVFAERIRTHENHWEVFVSANPGEALDAMAAAHTALVNYAKKTIDLASLVDAMETFAARAQRIGKAIQELRNR